MHQHRRMFKLAPALLCVASSSCVHYRARPLDPAQSESAYKERNLADPGLTAFIRSVPSPGSTAQWPPQKLDLATASLVAAYFNPSLKIARAQLQTAEAAMVTAGARPNPTAFGASGYETSPESPVVIRFELSLPIETARKRSYRILEAAKLADAARIGLKEASWLVYSQVRNAWMDRLAALDAQQAMRRETQIKAEVVSLMKERFSVGEASRPEWDAARVDASRTAVALQMADGQLNETVIRLAEMMGVPESALANVSLASANYTFPQPAEALPLARVQQKGLLNRLDIQRSLLEYAAAEARLQLEVARQYPDIQLNPGYDFDEGHHKFTFGPTLPIPVWNRNEGAIAEADAKRSEAEARFLALQSQVIAEMERALAAYRTVFSEFQEADQKWTVIQAGREHASVRAVQLGEEDRLTLNNIRLESVGALHAQLDALNKTRAAFSALEDAVQTPLGGVPWIQPTVAVKQEQP